MNKIKTYYPNILVALQFGIIAIMILLSHNFFKTLYPMAIFSFGAVLGVWALMHNRVGNFNIQPKLKENSILVTTGVYGYIRHPMYSSVVLMTFALMVTNATLLNVLLFLALIIVLLLKAKREETLWCDHDEAYIAYKKRSKFFIPFLV